MAILLHREANWRFIVIIAVGVIPEEYLIVNLVDGAEGQKGQELG